MKAGNSSDSESLKQINIVIEIEGWRDGRRKGERATRVLCIGIGGDQQY